MMSIAERTTAIGRAQRALQALGERPQATRSQLGTARERLNDCYRLSDPTGVWAAVTSIERAVQIGCGQRRADPPAGPAAGGDESDADDVS